MKTKAIKITPNTRLINPFHSSFDILYIPSPIKVTPNKEGNTKNI
jgi:hypothetical protein